MVDIMNKVYCRTVNLELAFQSETIEKTQPTKIN